MKQTTIDALMRAYVQLQVIVQELYEAQQVALDNNDLPDVSLLGIRADKLYDEAINLEHIINELEE
jgi:hypothetical protein